jgi:transposase-like protein
LIIIKNLIDDAKCFQTVREIRWKDGNIICPKCDSTNVIKHGFDEIQKERQKYHCKECEVYFDDLTDTIFSGHHQPLKVWILCLYFMGLNLSNNLIYSYNSKSENSNDFFPYSKANLKICFTLILKSFEYSRGIGFEQRCGSKYDNSIKRRDCKKKPLVKLQNEVECDEVYIVASHKGNPEKVREKG